MSHLRFLLFSFLALALSVESFGQVTFTQEDYSGGPATRDSFVAADFNRDGFDDVVYISYSQTAPSSTQMVIRLNDGNGGLLPEAIVPFQLPNSDDAPNKIATADFNSDGKLDLAVLFNSGLVVILFGNGDGTFTQGATYSEEPPVTTSKMVSADFDNNGSPDLAILNNDGSLSLLVNNGDGTFNSRTTQLDSSAGASYHLFLVAGDFNADGKMDLAWVDYAPCQQGNPCASTVYMALNTGGGNFSSPQQVISYPDNEVRLSSGDADGDGLTDLMTSAPYTVDLLFANSDGSFSRQTFATNLYAEGGALVTDVNGDGKLDIVAAGVSADSQEEVAFILGQGGRNFQTSGYQKYEAQSGFAEALEAGFFNSDSVKDLVLMVSGGSGYGLHVLLNTTQPNDPCPAPGNAGVNFCAPQNGSTTGNSVQFIATGRPDTQPMNRMELWVDGNKKFQVFNDRMDHVLDLENGSHQIDIVEVDAAGAYRKASAAITVTGPFATNSAFVQQQYIDFLDRQADQEGLNGWDNQLNSGLSRAQLIADFMMSQEFAQKGLFVAQAYLGILARDADYGGFRGWLSWLENGGTEVNLVNSLLSSSEFQSNFGSNLDNGQFVTRMYENVLLRQPDSGGYNYFVGQLNNGQMTRAQVGLALLQSSEFQNLTSSQHRVSVSLLYFDMLRRQPDSGGFNGWVNALNSGTALTDLINGFLNSREYSLRFQ